MEAEHWVPTSWRSKEAAQVRLILKHPRQVWSLAHSSFHLFFSFQSVKYPDEVHLAKYEEKLLAYNLGAYSRTSIGS